MGFYIRKSIKAGPFRFNLSKSGVGLSVGVRGLRFGTGPHGNYVRAGLGGFYYSQSLGPTRSNKTIDHREPARESQSKPNPELDIDGVRMYEIGSGEARGMKDSSAKHVLDQINENHRKVRLSNVLGLIFLFAAIVSFRISHSTAILLMTCSVIGYLLGRWIDSFRRTTVIYYDFETQVQQYYEQFVVAFNQISACNRVWHITSAGKINGLVLQKRNAGATMAYSRKQIRPIFGLPAVVKCNFDVPMLPLGKRTLYFFPAFLIMVDAKSVGSVNYENLTMNIEATRFIETEDVPRDTEVVGKTWKRPNKNGGPNRRFSNNRQYPICAYESILFESGNGVRELIEYSKRGQGQLLQKTIDYLCFANDPASRN